MQKTDYLSLDGHLLRLFVLVYETSSVSRTAEHLGINQSSVSHALGRLRQLIGEPLFVRSGRGIVPTARADALVADAGAYCFQDLNASSNPIGTTRSRIEGTIVIAANDYEVETILRPLLTLCSDKRRRT